MKFYIKSLVLILTVFAGLTSCQKGGSELDYGYSRVYMPQAINNSGGINNNLPVPSGTDTSTYNYAVDTINKRVNVILGVSLSGPQKGAYSVSISTNTDTINQMIAAGTLDATTQLMPSSMYTLPTNISVAGGTKGNTFLLSISTDSLKATRYAGKKLALAVKISNPTQYTLDTALATTIVIVDINALVIGPAVDITSTYIQNPGNPFITSTASLVGGRWGSLKYWTANAGALSHSGVGGYGSDGDGQTLDLESGWGSPHIYNGKVYQTITLLAGNYAFDPCGGSWIWQGTKDPAYVVVAPNSDTLPDYTNIVGNGSILYQLIASPQIKVSFQLSTSTKITLGFVVNYAQDQQGIKSKQVKLYSYPKHL